MISGLSLPSRIAVLVVSILVAASALTAMLNTSKFRRILENREFSIYSFVVSDIRGLVENGMNVGLPLTHLRNNQPMIERRKAADPNILEITIFAPDGRILFDTDRFRVDSAVAASLMAPGPEATEWKLRTDDGFVVGTVLVNSLGQVAGSIVLRFDSSRIERDGTSILVDVISVTLAVTGLAAIIAIAGLFGLLRPTRRAFEDLNAELSQMVHEVETSGGTRDAAQDGTDFLTAARRTLVRLNRAERLVERMGLSAKQGTPQ